MLSLLLAVQDTVVAIPDTVITSPGTEFALGGINALLAIAGGLAGTFLLGLIKKGLEKLGYLDLVFNQATKAIQPAIAGALAMILPWIANKIGMVTTPDGAILAAAPTMGFIGVITREIVARIAAKLKNQA